MILVSLNTGVPVSLGSLPNGFQRFRVVDTASGTSKD
jgi:hypothetical protein